MGGSGSNLAGYNCRASFALAGGTTATTFLGAPSILRARGCVPSWFLRTPPCSTPAVLAAEQAREIVFLVPTALLVVFGITVGALYDQASQDTQTFFSASVSNCPTGELNWARQPEVVSRQRATPGAWTLGKKAWPGSEPQLVSTGEVCSAGWPLGAVDGQRHRPFVWPLCWGMDPSVESCYIRCRSLAGPCTRSQALRKMKGTPKPQ